MAMLTSENSARAGRARVRATTGVRSPALRSALMKGSPNQQEDAQHQSVHKHPSTRGDPGQLCPVSGKR
jgi:hypothetical protein